MITLSWRAILYLVIGVIGLDIMIMVHELGHFLACKIFKVRVESLSVGTGPTIFQWGKNETKYKIRLIPFGGSTKMAGHDDLKAAIDKGQNHVSYCEEGSLYSTSPLKRILIYFAGPLANILFAILCFTVFLCIPKLKSDYPSKIVVSSDYPDLFDTPCAAFESGLKTSDEIIFLDDQEINSYSQLTDYLSENKDKVIKVTTSDNSIYTLKAIDGVFGILPFRETVVGSVAASSPEKEAGLKRGDIILRVNHRDVTNMFDLLAEIQNSDYLDMYVLRKGNIKLISFKVENKALNFTLRSNSIYYNGDSFKEAFDKSVKECFIQTQQFFGLLVNLLKGKTKFSQTLSGSINTSANIGMLATKGFETSFNTGIQITLYLLASVSLSLGVANLLPITALDGGLILTNIIELFYKKTFSPKTYIALQIIGLVVVLIIIPLLRLVN